MNIEHLDVVDETSFKEDLKGLKGDVEKQLFGRNPEIALQFWFEEKGNIPHISTELNGQKIISSPSIVRDTGFNFLLDLIKEKNISDVSLSSMEKFLMEHSIVGVPIHVSYVGPDGKNIFLTFQFEKDGDTMILSPFVRDSGDGGKTLEVKSDGDYTIKVKLNHTNGQREYFFVKKTKEQ